VISNDSAQKTKEDQYDQQNEQTTAEHRKIPLSVQTTYRTLQKHCHHMNNGITMMWYNHRITSKCNVVREMSRVHFAPYDTVKKEQLNSIQTKWSLTDAVVSPAEVHGITGNGHCFCK